MLCIFSAAKDKFREDYLKQQQTAKQVTTVTTVKAQSTKK
jgi:hypothetical protein